MEQRQKSTSDCKQNRFRKAITALIAAFALLGSSMGYYAGTLPDHFYTEVNTPLELETVLPVTASTSIASSHTAQETTLRLFGLFPFKTVALTSVQRAELYPGGEPFGIRMLMAGVMVVSTGEISTDSGSCCPAEDAGIRVGDVIQSINGKSVHSNQDIQKAIAASEGSPVSVTLLRDHARYTFTVHPVFSRLHCRWQTGMWVRDSTAGIGTVTYYMAAENQSAYFAGLGHAVCDVDTGEQIPLASGEVAAVRITDVQAGQPGIPGELHGQFAGTADTGVLFSNTECGLFGSMHKLPPNKQAVELAFKQEVTTGEAMIYTTIEGESPAAYTIEIEEVHSADTGTRNMVIHITDPALLALTGGIVQGMSGSPILQNGRLIGAVTHVFVKDPTRGYAIFAENMYAQTTAQRIMETE
ncbi:MAG: SpoIVB peptidase [Oscillospiraceae bacterium]|nr:SpoIVB peptidase [Oscillospiraceae bacterium]